MYIDLKSNNYAFGNIEQEEQACTYHRDLVKCWWLEMATLCSIMRLCIV